MSRKAWQPTPEETKQIELMCIAGVSQEQIAEVMGVNVLTLKKRCKEVLLKSRPKANSKVAGWLYQNCAKGNVTAQIFWLKTRAGWKETFDSGEKPQEIVFKFREKPEEVKK